MNGRDGYGRDGYGFGGSPGNGFSTNQRLAGRDDIRKLPSPRTITVLDFFLLRSTSDALVFAGACWKFLFDFVILPLLSMAVSILIRNFTTVEQHAKHLTFVVNKNTRSKRAIGRILDRTLTLVQSLSSTHVKYQFARTKVEEILKCDVSRSPTEPLRVDFITSLVNAFKETSTLLESLIQQRQGQSIVVKIFESMAGSGSIEPRVQNQEKAEKLARELQWIGKNLIESGGTMELCFTWSNSRNLANSAQTASPRVHQSLVQLLAEMIQQISNYEGEIPSYMVLNFVLLWLPLMCNIRCGGEGEIFNNNEKEVGL